MADRGQNIDIIFRNGLKEFEVLPPPEVWENISPAIGRHKNRWSLLKVAAVAAVIVSLSAIPVWLTRDLLHNFNGLSFTMNQEVVPSGSYVAVNKPAVNELAAVPQVISKQSVPDEIAERIPSGETYLKISNKGLFRTTLKEGRLSYEKVPANLTSAVSNGIKQGIADNISINFSPSGATGEKQPAPADRWTISAMASPSYYSSMHSGSEASVTEIVSKEKPGVSFSGGMSFAYSVSKRLSVQSGVYYSAVGQKITGINSYAGFNKYNNTKGGSQFSIITSSGMIAVSNPDIYLRDNVSARVTTGYLATSVDPAKASLTYMNNSISQNFRYLEVPVFFRYKALDKKIDVNVVGGVSYNMLIGNSSSANLDGVKYTIGKTEGLNPVNLSSSLGLGFEYNLSKKISVDLEPTFRYYLTPVGSLTGSSVHPYSFGIFSGLSYKF